jgi:diaminopimelate epimerase
MECLHMSGAGNDFMVIDARGLTLDFEKMALELCAKTGADGFMAVGLSDTADFRLHFYNSDGSRGEMCGNGARCICKFAFDHGIAGETMVVQTDAGLVYGWYLGGDRYRIRLNLPGLVDLQRLENAAYVELGDPGIPHSITFLEQLDYQEKEQLRPLALQLRHDPAFPKGVNVNLCARLAENKVRLLTYERGVEDYTLACGTGSASTAVVLWLKGQLPGGKLEAENPGGILSVTIEGTDAIEAIYLEGPAEILAQYDI